MPFIAMQLRSTKKREKGGGNPSLIDVILGCDLLQVGCKVIWGRMGRADDVQPKFWCWEQPTQLGCGEKSLYSD
jgi:hypothetical protein